jgi:hypothetical protein
VQLDSIAEDLAMPVVTELPEWRALEGLAGSDSQRPQRELFAEDARRFSRFSRQRLTPKVLAGLLKQAEPLITTLNQPETAAPTLQDLLGCVSKRRE